MQPRENASPGFIQRVISLTGYNWVILSQKPRKKRPRHSLLIPSEVYQHFRYSKDIPSKLLSITQQSISIPTEYRSPAWSLEYISPRRVIPFTKSIPSRSYLLLSVFLQISSQAEAKSTLQHQPRIRLPGIRQGSIFLDADTFINIAFPYIIACIYAS